MKDIYLFILNYLYDSKIQNINLKYFNAFQIVKINEVRYNI